MRLASLLIVSVLLIGQTPPVVQDPEKASLEGQVLDSATGLPVRKARVTLRMNVAAQPAPRPQQGEQPQPLAVVAVTDTGGKFLFPNLDPGDYRLVARHDGFADVQLGRDTARKAEPIVLAARDRKTGLTVKMTPHGAIAGRLTDEDGDPIPGQQVALFHYQYTTRGRELVETSYRGSSDDLGEFRIYNVPSGKYFLKAGASRPFGRSMENVEGFVPAFFPGTPNASNAAPIDLTPGQQLKGMNMVMRQAKLAVIRGRVIVPDGVSAEAGLMITSDSGTSSNSGGTDKDGKFEFIVPPGRVYVLGGFTLDGRRYRVFLPLDVGYSDIIGLELRPLPTMEVTGQVRIDGQTTVKVTEVQVTLQGPRSVSSAPKENGLVTFRELDPFVYRVVPSRAQALYLKSASWGTADVTDGEIDISNGVPPRTELTVVMGADGGQLEGTVKGENSDPIDGATITLVPTGSRRSRSYYRSATTNSQGHFTIRGIAPGSYKVFAWDTVNLNAVTYDPDFLRPYEGAGQNVEVSTNDKKSVNLKLTLNKSQ
jgi:Carboxypeptidase regulatory-like domain